MCACVFVFSWRDAGKRDVKSQLLFTWKDCIIVQIWGMAYEEDAFNITIILKNNMWQNFCLILSIMFKHIISFQKKAVKENYLAA